MAVYQLSKGQGDPSFKNVSTGVVVSTNPDMRTLYNSVLAGEVSVGDTIVAFGEFDFTGSINLVSGITHIHTGLDITYTGVESSGGLFNGLGISDTLIIGGSIDGNILKAQGIFFEDCDNVGVQGVKIRDTKNHGIEFKHCTSINASGKNDIANVGDDCITALSCVGGIITGNLLDVGAGRTGGPHGVELEGDASGAADPNEGGTKHITVSNNFIFTTQTIAPEQDSGGILVDSDADGLYISSHNTITGNVIKGIKTRGITIRAQGLAQTTHNTLGHNIITGCGLEGALEFIQAKHSSSTGDIIDGCFNGLAYTNEFPDISASAIVIGKHGIRLTHKSPSTTPCEDITITAPILTNIFRSGILIVDAKNYTIKSPRFTNMGKNTPSANWAIQTSTGGVYDHDGAVIEDVHIQDDQIGSETTRGINLADATNITIKGGKIGDNVLSTITSIEDGTVFIEGVKGFTTEASGPETSSGTTIIVTHELARTPNASQIHITPTNAIAGSDDWYISAIGGTTFTINCSNLAEFDWEIKAAGSDVG